MRALVPVSVRSEHEHEGAGNRIVVMRGPLPIYISDPLNRLRFVTNAMDGLKESKQALGAEVISGAQNFAPPTILAQASRLNFSTRLFNLIVTNVPGPQFPLYVLGREMLQAIPVAFLPENHAMAIAIMSYNGQMNFGLLGDFDALPDIDTIAESISAELQTLIGLAREQQAADRLVLRRGLPGLGDPLDLVERPPRDRRGRFPAEAPDLRQRFHGHSEQLPLLLGVVHPFVVRTLAPPTPVIFEGENTNPLPVFVTTHRTPPLSTWQLNRPTVTFLGAR